MTDRRLRSIPILLGSALAFAVGCSTVKRPIPPTATLSPRSLIDVDAPPGLYRPYDPKVAAAFLRSGHGLPTPLPGAARKSVLALSGGGMFGAYTAGVLKGWTASGRRPVFDVVTGISTGALIAPLAFLGPQFDPDLEARYTELKTDDIFKKRPILKALTSDSLADSAPLKRLIEAELTEDVVNQVAAAYAEGRRLFIGTTNLDSKRLVVWDMGAVASSGRPDRVDLFRKVILASCAFPGVLPPVAIEIEVDGHRYTEMHADGGVIASIFLDLSIINSLARVGSEAPAEASPLDVHAIVAGKLYTPPQLVKRGLFSVAGESLSGILQARLDGDLIRLYLLSNLTGGRFHLASVPQEMEVSSNFLAFQPAEMRRLFDTGYQFALQGDDWRTTPPGGEVSEQRLPRAGVRFETVPDAENVPGATPPSSRASPIGPESPGPPGSGITRPQPRVPEADSVPGPPPG